MGFDLGGILKQYLEVLRNLWVIQRIIFTTLRKMRRHKWSATG
jgi:hypothetical protein